MSSDQEVDEVIQEYFEREEWEQMGGYERKHYFNVKRNYEAMVAAGLNPRPPHFMTSQKSIKSRDEMKMTEEDVIPVLSNTEDIKTTETTDSFGSHNAPKEDSGPNTKVDSDELKNSMVETSNQLSPEEIRSLSQRYEEIDVMVNKKLKEWKVGEATKSKMKKSLKGGQLVTKESEHGKEEKPKTKKHKSKKSDEYEVENAEIKETEKPDSALEKNRYPKRRVARKNYKEPKDLDEDDFLFCDDCNREYDGPCPVHGPLKFMQNKKVPKDGSVSDRAFQTIPQGLSVCPSSIKGAGNGVWTDIPLQKGVVFGPYDGIVIDKAQQAQRSGYSWAIYKGGKPQRYIDAEDTSKSNWLRFVNCADCEERQNLIAFQYKGKIFYRTYKPVDIGTEFLVWYGDEYAKELGISTEEDPSKVQVQKVRKSDSEGYECVKCGALFSNEDAFLKHRKRRHWSEKELRHRCQYCNYTSNKISNVYCHERTHTGEKPHKCTQCGRTFSLSHHLKSHLLLHSGERPYSCDICCKSFTQRSTLKTHKSMHLQKKDHMCKFCGKTFVYSRQVLIHERIHNGQRPHKCDQCSMRFGDSSTLKRHVIYRHTKDFPHRCHHCNKGYCLPSQLQRHLQVHHLNEE